MLDGLQRLLQIDSTDAWFLAVYFPALAVLFLVLWHFRQVRDGQTRPTTARPRSGGRGRALVDRFAAQDITPNQISYTGLMLVAGNCVLYLIHRDTFWFATGLGLSYAFDALDGVVARRQHTASRFGSYLDAIIDRYQEFVTFAAIAYVNDAWTMVFFAITGSMLTSYAKARAAMEMVVENKDWPDMFGRPQRLWFLCVALYGQNTFPWMLDGVLALLGLVTHLTALRRFLRVRHMLHTTESESLLT